ncbi:MAG: tetratricopeptide repeat protein, partial [Isosphaerales bacterium]
ALDRAGRGSPDPALRPTEGVLSHHHDLPRFLGTFEQICQTMAYAHARGVIHRDLKPSNVMVGSFGEVQVMDWGLAKVLLQGGIADEAAAQPVHETVITTVRSGSAGSGSESQAGSVLGTPSYMAPEQARGEVDRIDDRADVFGLGAILCEILTGRPPFAGSTREEIRAQAARGELTDAFSRLEASGVDGDLIGLARDCLAAERDRRPRNAGAVVQRVTAYLAGVQERLRAAELARVEAQTRAEEEVKRRVVADDLAREARARAEEERKRRRMTVALAASVLITASVAGGGWAFLAQQRQERAARVTLALGEVEVLRTEAKRVGDDLARWLAARDAAHAVEGLLADAPDEPTRRHATEVVREVTQAAAAAENDQKLLARLVDIRSAKADDPDGSTTDAAYDDAFREAGIDVASLPPAEAGAKIRDRPTAVRVFLAAALDDWAAVRRSLRGDKAGARRLTEAARLADPDPWRNRLREVLQSSASPERLSNLKDLAKSARMEELPAVSLFLLGATLLNMGDPTGAGAVLREGQRLYPGDVWLNYTLVECLERLSRREEAIRYYMAARSLRPETAHRLAHALEAKGETDQAIALFKDLVRLRPKEGAHLGCLAGALQSRGRTQEAKAILDAMIAHYRAALRFKEGFPNAHFYLGNALKHQGNLDEAIAELRTALRLKPDHAVAYSNLGVILIDQDKLDQAITEFRAALRLQPDSARAHANLGNALRHQGKLDKAIAEYHVALRLEPDYAGAHMSLGNALRTQGKLDEAIAEYHAALQLKPDFADAHYNFGNALTDQGKPDEAIAEFRTALRLKPDYAEAHCNLGHVFRQRGRFVEALAEFKRGHELGSKDPNWHYPSAEWVRETERLVELDRKLPAILSGQAKPADPAETLALAELCQDKKLHGASARLWAEAFQAQPKLADDMQAQNRYNAACAAALAGSGQDKNDPPLDDATKARWRKQALDWLKTDLAAWSKVVGSGPAQARHAISQTLQHWKVDIDLAGLRDPAALAKLPENEQKACRALWAEVDALLAKSRPKTPP